MRRLLIILVIVGLGIAAAYYAGLFDRVTQSRVRAALVENGVPESMADCMAPRMVERLSLNQLRKLERAAPQDNETTLPRSTGEAMSRLRRIDDREAVEVTVTAAGGCAMQSVLDGLDL